MEEKYASEHWCRHSNLHVSGTGLILIAIKKIHCKLYTQQPPESSCSIIGFCAVVVNKNMVITPVTKQSAAAVSYVCRC